MNGAADNFGGPESLRCWLEGDSSGELELAHIAGSGGVAERAGVRRRVEVETGVDGVDVGMVENVERFCAELNSDPLCDWEALVDRGRKGYFFRSAKDA